MQYNQYFSVRRFAKEIGLSLSTQKISTIDRQCTEFCMENAIEIKPFVDADLDFKTVFAYPMYVIQMVVNKNSHNLK